MAILSIHIDLTPDIVERVRFGQLLDAKGEPAGATPRTAREWVIRDRGVPGLVLRMSRSSYSWNVQRRLNGKVTRRKMGHLWSEDRGCVPMSLDVARAQGRQWLQWMAEGRDPYIEIERQDREIRKQQYRDALTFGEAFDQFVATMKDKDKPRTAAQRVYVRKLMHKCPLWTKRLCDIDESIVAATFDPLLAAVPNRKPDASGATRSCALPSFYAGKSISAGSLNYVFGNLAAAHRFASGRLKLEDASFNAFSRWRFSKTWPQVVPRTNYLKTGTAGGVAWLKQLIDLAERANAPFDPASPSSANPDSIKPHVGAMTDFAICVLLWGTRLEETCILKWENIDFELGVVEIPRTKVGKVCLIPLTPWARQVLERRRRINEIWHPDDETGYVFQSRRLGVSLTSPYSVFEELEANTGQYIRPHDLRRTLATELEQFTLEQIGRLMVVGAVLNHAKGSQVTRQYIQNHVNTYRPNLERWENRVRKLAGLPSLLAKKRVPQKKVEQFLAALERDPETEKQLAEAIATRCGGRVDWVGQPTLGVGSESESDQKRGATRRTQAFKAGRKSERSIIANGITVQMARNLLRRVRRQAAKRKRARAS